MLVARTSASTCAASRDLPTAATPPAEWHAEQVASTRSGVSTVVAIEPWQVTQFGPCPSLRSRAKCTLERKYPASDAWQRPQVSGIRAKKTALAVSAERA